METTPGFSGLSCRACGTTVTEELGSGRCPDCGGFLDATYSLDALDLEQESLSGSAPGSMWQFDALLPFRASDAITMGEGATPLVDTPSLASSMGVERVLIKDEGRNPTGTIADRGMSLATTAARSLGAESIGLASTGNGGQSAAAYAARAGLKAHLFLPARSGFVHKAMGNVHGAEQTVVDGRIEEASAAFDAEFGDSETVVPVGAETWFRREGAKTAMLEIIAALDWAVPDAVVHPTGSGAGLLGLYTGARQLRSLGFIDEIPAFYAAQSTGCAPITEAYSDGRDRPDVWAVPDTICGGIEIPDPPDGSAVLEAIRESGGGAVASSDESILDAAVAVSQQEGIELDAASGAAASGAWDLAEREVFEADATVVVLNTGAGAKDDDVLRNHLVRKGV